MSDQQPPDLDELQILQEKFDLKSQEYEGLLKDLTTKDR